MANIAEEDTRRALAALQEWKYLATLIDFAGVPAEEPPVDCWFLSIETYQLQIEWSLTVAGRELKGQVGLTRGKSPAELQAWAQRTIAKIAAYVERALNPGDQKLEDKIQWRIDN